MIVTENKHEKKFNDARIALILDLLHDYYGPSIPLCQYPVYGTQGNPVTLDLLVNRFLLDWLIDFSLTLYKTCNLIKQIYSQRTQEQNKTHLIYYHGLTIDSPNLRVGMLHWISSLKLGFHCYLNTPMN